MQPTHGQRFYYPELDGLRFIAFLLVFIHNANPILKNTFLEKFSAYSWFGVDLFFCLSAFLITKLLVTEHQQTGKINIRNFYIRRVLRIWPLYFFYIFLGTLIIILFIEQWNFNLPGYLASLVTFTFNFAYFALLPFPIVVFIHLWSISFEEQFYAVIPWFLRKTTAIQNKSKWMVLFVLFLLGSAIRAIFIYFEFHNPWIYFLPFTRFDSILGGIAFGLGLINKPMPKLLRSFIFYIGVFCVSLIFILPNINVTGWTLLLTYPLVGLGMSLIIFSATNHDKQFWVRIISNKVFVYLGKISYGLYVYHFSVFTLSVFLLSKWLRVQQLTFPKDSFLVLLISFGMTFLFSFASYNLLEKPFLRLKERFGLVLSRPI